MLAQIGAILTPSSVGSIAKAKHPVDDIAKAKQVGYSIWKKTR
jgi:hypothetical protein